MWFFQQNNVFPLPLPEAPVTFTVPLQDKECEVDDEVTLTCELSKLDQKVKWMKNGKLIKPDKKTKITVDGKVHKMTIPKSALDDTAEYTVKLGDDSTSGKLTVKGEEGLYFSMET